jgi:hypothetical protein
MTKLFLPHMQILTAAQWYLWPELQPARDLGLVLYGGTAIALQLGHRSSADFDFFTERQLDPHALRRAFSFIPRATVLQEQPDTLSLQIPSGQASDKYVNVSFFGDIAIGRVGEPLITDDTVLQVASLDDLMATKVKVILQRVEAKDYQDIAAMVTAGVSLARGLASARAMYGSNFQPSESLKAMTYFEGGDLHALSRETRETLMNATRIVRELPRVVIASRSLSAPDEGRPSA